jgi:hypothetical protein
VKFILQKDARIGWRVNSDDIVSDFSVIEVKEGSEEPMCFRALPFTTGNCIVGWEKLDEFEMTMSILRLFFDYKLPYRELARDALLQCGQIVEAKKIREMARSIYYCDLSLEEFENDFYNQQIRWV